MYKCEHFDIEELVTPELHSTVHEDVLWSMFDTDLLKAIDWLRGRYGSATINNWKWKGAFTQSGIRTKDSVHYSKGSMHSVGKAFDLKFKNVTAQYIRDDLVEMEFRGEEIPKGIRRIENKVSWLHVDCKHTGRDTIHFFNP